MNDKPRAWDRPSPEPLPKPRALTSRERTALWAVIGAVPALGLVLLFWWMVWAGILAVALAAVAVVEALRWFRGGIGSPTGAWVTFAAAAAGWGSAAWAVVVHELWDFQHLGTPAGAVLAVGYGVALLATVKPVALGVRRWSMQLRTPQLLDTETQAEAQERGWDGHR